VDFEPWNAKDDVMGCVDNFESIGFRIRTSLKQKRAVVGNFMR